MSYSDYALSIAQKYRLALSIAVLNTKPEDVTIDQYIDQIRNSISNSEGDLDTSVCSDDFNISCINEQDDFQSQNVNQISCESDVTKDDLIYFDAQGNREEVRAKDNDDFVRSQGSNVQIQGNIRSQVNVQTQEKNERSQSTDVKTQMNNVKSCDVNVRSQGNNVQKKGNVSSQVNVRTQEENERSQGNNVEKKGNVRSQVTVRTQEKNYRSQGTYVLTQMNNVANQINDSETKANDSRLQLNVEIQGKSAQDSDKSIILLNHKGPTNMDRNNVRREMYREVIQVMKGVNSTKEDAVNNHGFICNVSLQAKPFESMDIDLTQCFDNNSQMLTERDLMTEENIVINNNCQNNYQVQNNDPYVTKDNCVLSQDKSEKLDNLTNSKRTSISSKNPYLLNEEAIKDSYLKKTCTAHKEKYDSALVDKMNKMTSCKAISEDVEDKLPKTQYTQHNTHYSPSQAHITIDNRLIIGYKHKTNDGKDIFDTEMFSQNTQDIFVDSLNCLTSPNDVAIDLSLKEHPQINIETQEQNNCTDNLVPFPQDMEIDACEDINALSQKNIESSPDFLEDMHINDSNNQIESLSASLNFIENTESRNRHTIEYKSETIFKPRFDRTKIISNFDENNDKTENNCTVTDTPIHDIDSLNRESETESMIPFKILEEINKIKSYLNKKCLTQSPLDSGYRSSQSKCSFKSSQSANASIGESANSVYHYMFVCPLVTATQDLTDQMAEVLGLLIDRLHQDEIYPPFFEELLTSVHTLLIQLYEEDCGDFDVLTRKDEQTQRIILLTKSSHIQKFAIEKINGFLQQLLDAPKQTNHESQNVAKINNLPYIFHILQTLIPKYNAPSTQNTQEDEKTLRKKDISDLWRKKWIPNFKEISNEGTCEEICVVKECGAILNRLVVDFMEGYSLVAFCALECFNMLQS